MSNIIESFSCSDIIDSLSCSECGQKSATCTLTKCSTINLGSTDRNNVSQWPERWVQGAKRANVVQSDCTEDWFVGHGKCEGSQFEGTWWDMVCFARNVLASHNTRINCPEYWKPELKNDNYTSIPPYALKEM